MDLSVCIATYYDPTRFGVIPKSIVLSRVLKQLRHILGTSNLTSEIIVVDDGSPTHILRGVCEAIGGITYIYLDRKEASPGYGNPARARNRAYQEARGRVLICQSDDVLMVNHSVLSNLYTAALAKGRFGIARVINTNWELCSIPCNHPCNPSLIELTGPSNKRPVFFLGSVLREYVYEIGGNDPRFVTPGREDIYFSDCLMKGLGLKPIYLETAIGYHLHHERPDPSVFTLSRDLYTKLVKEGTWRSQGAPWPYTLY